MPANVSIGGWWRVAGSWDVGYYCDVITDPADRGSRYYVCIKFEDGSIRGYLPHNLFPVDAPAWAEDVIFWEEEEEEEEPRQPTEQLSIFPKEES